MASTPALNRAAAADSPSQQERRSDMQRNLTQALKQLGPVRLAATLLFLLLALLVARASWSTLLIQDAERAMFDVRSAVTAPKVEKDQRIVMVVYDDNTLRLTGQRSPVDRTILARALTNITAAKPKAIGIDILFDMAQDDDALLKAEFARAQVPIHLAYANAKTNTEITFEQEEYLNNFHAEVKSPFVGPASIKVSTDPDNVARRWVAIPPEQPPFFAFALAGKSGRFAGYEGAIRYHVPALVDAPVFDKIPIEQLADPQLGPAMAAFLAGKYVLIGGDFVDRDRFEVPVGQLAIPQATIDAVAQDKGELDIRMIGLEVHANMLAQLLNDDRPAAIPAWSLWAAALLVMVTGGLSALLAGSPFVTGLIIAVQLIFFLVLPFVLQMIGVDTLDLPAFGWLIGWLLSYAAVGSAMRVIGSKQRRFAQNALGKYLPPSVAGEILKNPERLALHGEKREIFAVFTDLEGFTKLSHAIEPEMVATLLNAYLDRLADVVLQHGGTLDKFVGDAVVAFWGAPLSRADDGERAARAAYAMYEAGEAFRRSVPEGVPPVGRTRVGMHFGPAIVGNFGGEDRIQYTAFGDSMNTAARLEGANKALGTKVLISREAAERTGLDWFRPMGRITLRGRSTPVEIFEPVPHWSTEERCDVSTIIADHQKGDITAVQRLAAMVQKYREDDGLANLLQRLEATSKGESYVLG